MQIEAILGDITTFVADAIANAANCTLLGGGGVDGAIHRAAGPELLEYCAKLGGCRTGEAKITPGFNLPAKYVIHTPGPVYGSCDQETAEELLSSCYVSCLRLAEENGCRSVGFPSISTGVYGFPLDLAAEVVAETFKEYVCAGDSAIEKITMVCFDEQTRDAYAKAFERRLL